MTDDNLILQMYQEPIIKVNEFKYLGNIISNKGSNKHHIKQRIKMTMTALLKIKNHAAFDNSFTHYKVKTQLYKSFIRHVLLYGSEETLFLNNKEIKRLTKIESKTITKCLGLSS